MPELNKPNHLYEILPDGRWKIKFDHHMIADFGTCERLFSLKHVTDSNGKVIRAKGGYSWPASFGIWWASVLEDFYIQMENFQKGFVQEPTKGDILRYAAKHWMAYDMDKFAIEAPKQYSQFIVGMVGLNLGPMGDVVRFPVGVMNIVDQYFQYSQAKKDSTKWKIIATESTFGTEGDVIVAESNKVVIAYQGRPDHVIYDTVDNILEPVDNKTTSSIDGDFPLDWKPNAQMTGYAVCVQELCKQLGIKAEVKSVTINAAARDTPALNPKPGNKPKSRFDRFRISYDPTELQEWRDQMLIKGERLRHALEHNAWMMKETSCHNQFNRDCEFKSICRLAPKDRAMMIASNYSYQEPWTPKTT